MSRFGLLIVAVLGFWAQGVLAQTPPPNSGAPGADGGRPPGPPPEAFSACSLESPRNRLCDDDVAQRHDERNV